MTDFCLPSSIYSARMKMKMQHIFILCLFLVVMAAVSEVSLCQVPVGLTPVFEADKH